MRSLLSIITNFFRLCKETSACRKSISAEAFESLKKLQKLLISMARDPLLGFPSHTLPYRGCEFSAFESVQILRRAFVSSLCLIPRRAPRLCWLGLAGVKPASTVGIAPYKLFCRAGPMCPAAHRTRCKTRHCEPVTGGTGVAIRIPCAVPPAAPFLSSAKESNQRTPQETRVS